MRPTRIQQHPLLAPLNRILGTEAGVRVLRVLTRTREPLSSAQVARQAELDPAGVRRTIADLTEAGLIDEVGAGGRRLVQLRAAHPLAAALAVLFQAEAERLPALLDAIGVAARALEPLPIAVWARFPDPSRGTLATVEVGIIARALEVDATARRLRSALHEVVRAFDIDIEVRGFTRADLLTLDEEEREALSAARHIVGASPVELLMEGDPGTASRTHADLDLRALALARAIGDRIVRDPSIVERAREYVARYLASAASGERWEMEEWAGILDTMPPHRLRAFLVDEGQRATRLRQSLPFLNALTPEERRDIFRGGAA